MYRFTELHKETVGVTYNTKTEMESEEIWQSISGNVIDAVNAVNV